MNKYIFLVVISRKFKIWKRKIKDKLTKANLQCKYGKYSVPELWVHVDGCEFRYMLSPPLRYHRLKLIFQILVQNNLNNRKWTTVLVKKFRRVDLNQPVDKAVAILHVKPLHRTGYFTG